MTDIAKPPIVEDDLAQRSLDIHWPDWLSPSAADLFAHNEITISAPPACVWDRLITATRWPQWYSNAANVVVDSPSGVLSEGATFEWTTFGLAISSTVAEFAPYMRLAWHGNGDGLRAYHAWLLVPLYGGTHVVMEEIGLGDTAKKLVATNPGHMHRGHELWNVSLKFLCEAAHVSPDRADPHCDAASIAR
jgi:Polyketide cyclase / dehydrase and lipid transport